MKLHTTRTRIRAVPAAWHAQYDARGPGAADIKGRPFSDVTRQLDAIDTETATADDVARIIGNHTWTELACSECGTVVPAVVEVGEEPDYESATAMVCESCLRKALALAAEPVR